MPSHSAYCCMQFAYNWDIVLTLMLAYPSQCQRKILEYKGKVCDSDSNCCDVGLCDVSSGAQRTLGQNHQKSMLVCILQNLTGSILSQYTLFHILLTGSHYIFSWHTK